MTLPPKRCQIKKVGGTYLPRLHPPATVGLGQLTAWNQDAGNLMTGISSGTATATCMRWLEISPRIGFVVSLYLCTLFADVWHVTPTIHPCSVFSALVACEMLLLLNSDLQGNGDLIVFLTMRSSDVLCDYSAVDSNGIIAPTMRNHQASERI